MSSHWLQYIQKLQAIAQNGLHYSKDPFDRERFQQLRALAADMLADLSDEDPETISGVFQDFEHTATPKIDVRAFVMRHGKALFVREKSDGRWTLPGGWADVGKTLSESVVAEVREEAGYIVQPVRILAVYDRSRHPHPPHLEYTYKIFVQCEILLDGAPDDLETDGRAFFPPDGLPPLSADRVTQAQLERMFVLAADPCMPADFD